MTKKELEDYLWGAANILRGMIDAADFKQYIFPLLFFKRISDVWDEEYKIALEESGHDFDYASYRETCCYHHGVGFETVVVSKFFLFHLGLLSFYIDTRKLFYPKHNIYFYITNKIPVKTQGVRVKCSNSYSLLLRGTH